MDPWAYAQLFQLGDSLGAHGYGGLPFTFDGEERMQLGHGWRTVATTAGEGLSQPVSKLHERVIGEHHASEDSGEMLRSRPAELEALQGVIQGFLEESDKGLVESIVEGRRDEGGSGYPLATPPEAGNRPLTPGAESEHECPEEGHHVQFAAAEEAR